MRVRSGGCPSSSVFLFRLDNLVIWRRRTGVDGMSVLSSPVVMAV